MDDRKTTPRDGRLIRILLVASLALNLLVVGLAAGWALRHAGGAHPSRLDMAGGPLTRALSTEDRHRIGQQMRAAWRAADDGRGDLRDSYDALLADLRAVPFDPAVVRVNRLHILKRYRQYLEAADAGDRDDAALQALHADCLARAHADFAASDARTEKVFPVFHRRPPGFVPLTDLTGDTSPPRE